MEYVREALDRARARQSADASSRRELTVSYVESDLDLVNASQRIPLADESVQAIIASLFLSYVEAPHRVLADTFRILRPGGRMVISSLRRDADISRLYAESFAELQIGTAGKALPEFSHERLGHIARNFLNDAARILELEDSGAFHFWDAIELTEMLQNVGFSVVHSELALGAPPQAVVLEVRKS
jgi:ubiquinone/menaquinone biosynthesis C-methylase UbiE